MRLNNLCAQGAYSGVYWNDNSFQEYSYVTGADSAEMGQGGMRVNMVPKDGGNSFKGVIFGNYAGESFASDNCAAPGLGQFCTRDNLSGDVTFNKNNTLTNVSDIRKIWDFNPSIGGPIKKDKLWFNFTFRHWGVNKTTPDSFFDSDPSPLVYTKDLTRPGIDDGHIISRAGRLAYQASQKDKITWYHDWQNKYRNHWGIASTVPPDASAIQVTPTSFVDVTRWTRTHTNRLLFDAGIAIYDQEYTELYQPEVTGQTAKVWDLNAIRNSKVYNVVDNTNSQNTFAWNAPADHFSLLRTFSGSMSYVTGSHSMKFGAAVTNGDRRLVSVYTGDVQPITFNAGVPVSVRLQLPRDQRDGIKADTGIYAQDRWTMGRATLNLGLRYDQFIGETQEEDLLAGRFNAAQHFGKCADGQNSSKNGCVGQVQDWKDLSPRIGVAYDLFGDGKTAIKASFARYVNGEQVATAVANNPITSLGLTDTRPWTDIDKNGSPFDAAGNIQLNELSPSASTPTFGKNVSTSSYDPSVLNGWNKRGYNLEYTIAAQHQLAARVSVSGGYFRRTYRQPGVHRRFALRPEQLRRSVLHHGAIGSAVARRRQLPGLRSLRSQAIGIRVGAACAELDQVLGHGRGRNQPVSGIRRQPRGAIQPGRISPNRCGRWLAHVRQLQPGEGRLRCAVGWRHGHHGNVFRRHDLLPPRIPVPSGPQAGRLLHAAGRHTVERHVSIQPRCSNWWQWSKLARHMGDRLGLVRAKRHCGKWRGYRCHHPAEFDARPSAERGVSDEKRPVDPRGSRLRTVQSEPAGPAGLEAAPHRQVPRAWQLRPL